VLHGEGGLTIGRLITFQLYLLRSTSVRPPDRFKRGGRPTLSSADLNVETARNGSMLIGRSRYWNMINNAYRQLNGIIIQFTTARGAAQRVFGAKHTHISFAPFYILNMSSFYQDRLGTNIRRESTQKESDVCEFSSCLSRACLGKM
jgi:hypothetical protein